MIKYFLILTSFTAIALGAYAFQSEGKSSQTSEFSGAVFVAAPIDDIVPQTAEPVQSTPLFSSKQPIIVKSGSESRIDLSRRVPVQRPVVNSTPPVDLNADDISEATLIALTSIESISGVRVSTASPTPEPMDLGAVVARSLAQTQDSAYLKAVGEESKDTRVVATPRNTMFDNTIISDTRVVSATAIQSLSPQDASYIAQLTETNAPPKRLASAKKYIVRKGDNLSRISFIHYGRTSDYVTIFQANRDKLKTPNQIMVGQQLIIPAL